MGNHAKLNYIHIFRAIAIIIIVLGHSVDTSHEIMGILVNIFIQGGTVLFVFISGFLFQYLSDNFSYPTYLKKKFFNVILPYLLTSVIGITWVFLFAKHNPFVSINKIVQVGMFLTTGYVHNLPTWYIPMTSILFLSAAVLLKLEKKIVFNKYSLLFFILPVLICVSCFLPSFKRIVFANEEIMSAWQVYAGYLEKILFDTVSLFPIYILGMFFAKYRQKYIKILYQKRVLIWTMFIGGSIILFFLTYYHFLPAKLLFTNVMMILLILGYLWHYDEKIKEHEYINKYLGIIADYSFAIFFFHFYFIRGLVKLADHFSPWLFLYLSNENFHLGYWIISAATIFSISFFGSLFVAMLIKKVLEKMGIKHTRYFIGA